MGSIVIVHLERAYRAATQQSENDREYQVRVECFRSGSGYADAHYAYHQVPYVMARP